MRKILSGYDGIWIDAELAKAARWYLAALHLLDDTEITEQCLSAIASRDFRGRQRVEQTVANHTAELRKLARHAGGSRMQFAMGVWDDMLAGQMGLAEVEKVRQVFFPVAERIAEPLLDWLPEPINPNLAFFKQLRRQMSATYWDEHPFGLVTQAESAALFRQFSARSISHRGLWGEYFELLIGFGDYRPGKGFPFAECAGDYAHGFLRPPAGEEKVAAYRIMCGRLGVRPEETITFEDTELGCAAARAAGLRVVGVPQPAYSDALPSASCVVRSEAKLSALLDVTEQFVRCEPVELVAMLIGEGLAEPGSG